APYQLDARRCLAYLLIEHHGAIPEEFRAAVGDRLFGCDDCLDACPWNKWAQATREAALAPREYPDARAMLVWTEEDYRQHTQGTPLARLKLPRLKRNAAVVLGNQCDAANLPALRRGLNDSEAIVRSACAWALGQYDCDSARETLRDRLAVETDADVRDEISGALEPSAQTLDGRQSAPRSPSAR
ncbi:MAG: epoxyqueuosine reductase, partial [Candidatus Saccharimonadales bacterium]